MLDERTKKRIYERIRKRYKRASKRIEKEFREIEINGLYFKEALELELKKEEELAKKGEESRLKHSRSVEKRESYFSPELVISGEEQRQKSNTFIDEEFLSELSRGETPERRQARKEFEEEINRELEQACTERICPRCKSSVCHCPKLEGEENE